MNLPDFLKLLRALRISLMEATPPANEPPLRYIPTMFSSFLAFSILAKTSSNPMVVSTCCPIASAKAAEKGSSSERSTNLPFKSNSYTEFGFKTVTVSLELANAPIIPNITSKPKKEAIKIPTTVASVYFKNCFIEIIIIDC